jgi:hypothetical protein
MRMRQPLLDASLTDGQGYMVGEQEYQFHLQHSVEIKQVSLSYCMSVSSHQLRYFSNYRSQLAQTTKHTTLWNLCHPSWMRQGLVYVHAVGMVATCRIQWRTFRRVKGVWYLNMF